MDDSSLKIARRNKDHYAGVLLAACGLAVAWRGFHYEIGTLKEMGPGFVPLSLGIILVILGAAISIGASQARRSANAEDGIIPALSVDQKATAPEWKGWFCIVAGIVLFIVVGKYFGLLPATFATVFVSALGDKKNTWRSALLLALVMVLICLVIFHWCLKIQFSLIHWG